MRDNILKKVTPPRLALAVAATGLALTLSSGQAASSPCDADPNDGCERELDSPRASAPSESGPNDAPSPVIVVEADRAPAPND